ncbi:MAG: sigma-70 family RNA polymerase sigma factor [Bacteroidetes bacterium]|nr:MAG: sigma-70 family RNA polymerase sigma factor [Bacteroidota bacterium]
MTEEELISGCLQHDPAAQRDLYLQYFNRSMRIGVRYSKNSQEAKVILLDGFKNILNRFKNYVELNAKREKNTPPVSLEEWIKNEIIASAVQHMHDNKKHHFVSSTISMRDSEKQTDQERSDEQIMKSCDKQMIVKALQQLTPSYRTIYNLHEVEGYSHTEISRLLDISEYISKDSLLKAKFNLRKNISRLIPK